MKYLVTGGAGFIGNSLALQLSKLGHEVVVLDNFNGYYDVELKEARVARLPKDIKVVRADLTNQVALTELFRSERFDAVAHLAAQAGVRYSLEAPEQYVESNFVGTFQLLEAARAAGVKRVVYASTSSAYGEEPVVPFVETMPADRPVSIYAATKRSAELLGHVYHQLYGFDFTVLRFFTVYGPWGRPDMAPYIFTDKILRGEAITVFNHGEMRRDFTFIDDIVAGFTAALLNGTGYEIYNLGNGHPVELPVFIEAIEAAVGLPALIEYAPLQPGDVTQTFADIKKAERDLGYSPQTPLVSGIKEYVTWFRDYYQR